MIDTPSSPPSPPASSSSSPPSSPPSPSPPAGSLVWMLSVLLLLVLLVVGVMLFVVVGVGSALCRNADSCCCMVGGFRVLAHDAACAFLLGAVVHRKTPFGKGLGGGVATYFKHLHSRCPGRLLAPTSQPSTLLLLPWPTNTFTWCKMKLSPYHLSREGVGGWLERLSRSFILAQVREL